MYLEPKKTRNKLFIWLGKVRLKQFVSWNVYHSKYVENLWLQNIHNRVCNAHIRVLTSIQNDTKSCNAILYIQHFPFRKCSIFPCVLTFVLFTNDRTKYYLAFQKSIINIRVGFNDASIIHCICLFEHTFLPKCKPFNNKLSEMKWNEKKT